MKYLIVGVLFLLPFAVNAEELVCPEGQVVQSVEVSPAIPAVPAVTHIEVVVDTPAWDEVVIDSPAYTSCDYVGAPAGDYKNSSCTSHGDWWQEVYKKTNHPAVTHTVHHEAITHEEVVVDVPEVVGTPAVYENQCVTDPEYMPPVSTPKPEVHSTPTLGGHRKCGLPHLPTCEEWVKTLGQSISPQQQLVNLLQQLVALYQKLLAQ